MKDKEIVWGSIPIKGLEDGDFNKFPIEYFNRSDAHKGRIVSNETREKFSKIHKGKKISDEQKRKQSELLKGKKFSEEHKQKIGAKHKGKIVSENTRKKLSKINKGKKLSEEAKEKCRQSSIGVNLGRKHTQETKDKLSKARIGTKASEETKKKLSESQKKRTNHFNEEAIKNRLEKNQKPILCYSLPDMKLICEYKSINDAATDLKRNRGGIIKILKGKIKQPRNITFIYKDIS